MILLWFKMSAFYGVKLCNIKKEFKIQVLFFLIIYNTALFNKKKNKKIISEKYFPQCFA